MSTEEELLQLVEARLENVRRSGADQVVATCPFHLNADGEPERNPSFRFSLSKGLYHCFACKASGNLYTFLRDLGTSQALIETRYRELLDEVATTRPKDPDTSDPGVFTQETLPEDVLGLFDKCPLALINDGFTEKTLQYFSVGFDDWHMRITYPIRDLKARLVGISGRAVVEDDHPRYLFYTQKQYNDLPGELVKAPPLNKSRLLWNAERVYPAVYWEKDASVILVEGFKACMWLHQAGFTNVVASLGSRLSYEQTWILERMGATVYFMYDQDDAGIEGMIRSGNNLAKSLDVKIVQYPTHQPDQLDPTEIQQYLNSATDFHQWITE